MKTKLILSFVGLLGAGLLAGWGPGTDGAQQQSSGTCSISNCAGVIDCRICLNGGYPSCTEYQCIGARCVVTQPCSLGGRP